MKPVLLLVAVAAALPLTVAAAKPAKVQSRPEAFDALVRCRAIADAAQRLQCFDSAAAALEQAAESRELVVVDRKQVRETKRNLFGLDIPNLNPFGGGPDEDSEAVNSIEGVVASSFRGGDNRWVVRLEDGGTWGQTDSRPLLRPRPGDKVKIVRAAMGSYMMRVGSQPGVRVKRRI